MTNEDNQSSLSPHQEEAIDSLDNLENAQSVALPAHLGKTGLEGSTKPVFSETYDEQLLKDLGVSISATPTVSRVALEQRAGRSRRPPLPLPNFHLRQGNVEAEQATKSISDDTFTRVAGSDVHIVPKDSAEYPVAKHVLSDRKKAFGPNFVDHL